MTEQVVTLRITGENGQVVGVIRTTRAELDGLGKTAIGTGQQMERGARQVDKYGDSAERSRQRVSAMAGSLRQLAAVAGVAIGAQTVAQSVRAADSYSDIVGKLAQVTEGERELAQAKAATYAISQQTFQSLDATTTLYSRSAMALEQYNVSQLKVSELTRTINQGLLVSRATTAESASAILQLSQAMGAGALRGEEFNAVNEAAPRLMKALADSLGVPRGALKAMAEEGDLTVDKLLAAWTGPQAAAIAREASEIPLTIGRAWQQMQNSVLRGIGEFDQAIGTSGGLARGIQALTTMMGELAAIAIAVAIAYGGRLLSGLTVAAAAKARNTAESIRMAVAERQASQAALGSASAMALYAGGADRVSAAQQRVNAAKANGVTVMGRMGNAAASLGRGLVAFAGGPLGIVITGVGLLAAGFVNASAKARQLREDVKSALEGVDAAIKAADRDMIASAGERLLSTRQLQADRVAGLERNVDQLRLNPIARSTGIYDDRVRELSAARDQLDRMNVAVARNARELDAATRAAQAAADASGNGTAENIKFNESLQDQNEKLRIARIEREQGIRAALEYQATQAAGAQSVEQLSQATRDLIDEQVRERTAADVAKEAASGLKDAEREAEQERKKAAKALEDQREAQAQHRIELERETAELQGPLAEAIVAHRQRLADLKAELEAGNIEWDIYRARVEAADEALAKSKERIADETSGLKQAREAVRGFADDLTEEAERMRAAASSGGRLKASQEIEIRLRRMLSGLSKERIAELDQEIERIRKLAGEIDGLDAFNQVRDSITGALQGTIAEIQNGGDAWDAFRREGLRALTDILPKLKDFQKSGQSLKALFVNSDGTPTELMTAVGTLAGGGGQGAQRGAALGGAIGSVVGSIIPVIGTAIGGMIGTILGGIIGGQSDKPARVRLSGENVRGNDRNFTFRTVFGNQALETDGISGAPGRRIISAIQDFDRTLAGLLSREQFDATADALANFDASHRAREPDIELLLEKRFDVVLKQFSPLIQGAVDEFGISLEERMQALSDLLKFQELEEAGDLLTGSLQRTVDLLREVKEANETLGQAYQRLATAAAQYGGLIGGVQEKITRSGLSDYENSVLDVELAYRNQIRQANELAKAMGLTGARSEDLASIEQLRAIRLAELQRAQEEQQRRAVDELRLDQSLSPLRDQQRLDLALQRFNEAASSGDFDRANELSRTVLELGRSIFSSGSDYNALFGQVTGTLAGITQDVDPTRLGDIADILMDLPENIARAMFDALYDQEVASGGTTAPPPVNPPGGGGTDRGDRPGGDTGVTIEPHVVSIDRKLDLLIQAVVAGNSIELRRELAELNAGGRR